MSARVLQDVDPTKWKEHLYNLPPERWTSLQGKSFWITGAGTGYGRAIACGLAAAGCQVFLTGRRRNKLQETIEEISSMEIVTDNCHIVEADITNYDEMARACGKVTSLFGGLHGLVNNAAMPSRPGSLYPLQQDPLEYSLDPYIDHEVRLNRMRMIATALHRNKVMLGPYAESMIIKTEKDLGPHNISREPGSELERDREQYANL